jgi:hypothetical protein
MTDDSGSWIPICPVCQTETITWLHGQHRCLECGKLWDGSERTGADVFVSGVIRCDDSDSMQDVMTEVLQQMWQRNMIEGGVPSVNTRRQR